MRESFSYVIMGIAIYMAWSGHWDKAAYGIGFATWLKVSIREGKPE